LSLCTLQRWGLHGKVLHGVYFLHQCMIRGRQSSVRCPGRRRAAYLDPTRGTTFACQFAVIYSTTSTSSTYRSTILTYCTYYCCSFDLGGLEPRDNKQITKFVERCSRNLRIACMLHNTTHHSPPCSLAPQKLYIPKAFNHHTLSKPWWSSF
jgi:hypothetical protein